MLLVLELATGLLGVAVGVLATIFAQRRVRRTIHSTSRTEEGNSARDSSKGRAANAESCDRRERLPEIIVLVRHGESEGNADDTLYRSKPDHVINLTPLGVEQAVQAGERLEREVIQAFERETSTTLRRVHLTVSPFERTLQTAAALRIAVDDRIVRTDIEPRIREQEFGNIQTTEFRQLRKEQRRIGRFWYRFPTGESGADVYGRVKSWWFESVLTVNDRAGYEPVDALIVVTHGLTMRFVLMQLYGWSPTTFHSVWNAENCSMYVLRKRLHKPGLSPYVLDPSLGDMPKSSIDVQVEYHPVPPNRDDEETPIQDEALVRTFTLWDYLSIPTPRTRQYGAILERLQEQYPQELGEATTTGTTSIRKVSLTPFVFNHGGDDVWNLIEARRRKALEPDRRLDKFQSSLSFPSSAADAPRASQSRHSEGFTTLDSDEEDEVNGDDEFTIPRVDSFNLNVQDDLSVGSRKQRLRLSQEFSCRIPESDCWQPKSGASGAIDDSKS